MAWAVFLCVSIMAGGCARENSFAFGVIADVQYADKPPSGGRFYREAIDRLSECARELNEEELEFVVQLGDVIDGPNDPARALDDILAEFDKIKSRRFHVLGNHDFNGIDRKTVLEKLGMDRAYLDFTRGNWRFVILDTMDLAVNGGWDQDTENYQAGKEMLNRLIAEQAPNAVEWSGGIGKKQKDWLKTVLADARSKRQKVIIFGHIPLQPADEFHTLWNSGEIVKLLESYDCVAAYFCGHRHGGGYTLAGGIHYVTIEAMVESPERNAYAIVEVCPDRLKINGFGDVPDRIILVGSRE